MFFGNQLLTKTLCYTGLPSVSVKSVAGYGDGIGCAGNSEPLSIRSVMTCTVGEGVVGEYGVRTLGLRAAEVLCNTVFTVREGASVDSELCTYCITCVEQYCPRGKIADLTANNVKLCDGCRAVYEILGAADETVLNGDLCGRLGNTDDAGASAGTGENAIPNNKVGYLCACGNVNDTAPGVRAGAVSIENVKIGKGYVVKNSLGSYVESYVCIIITHNGNVGKSVINGNGSVINTLCKLDGSAGSDVAECSLKSLCGGCIDKLLCVLIVLIVEGILLLGVLSCKNGNIEFNALILILVACLLVHMYDECEIVGALCA